MGFSEIGCAFSVPGVVIKKNNGFDIFNGRFSENLISDIIFNF
jgi:hypothetical protein